MTKILLITAGCHIAVGCLAWIQIEYERIMDELERDIGWSLMWHERIMDERNEPE